MRKNQWIALLLAVMLVLSIAPASLADTEKMEKGLAKGGQYSTSAGLSFTIPDAFTFATHKLKNLDFLRIIFTGKMVHNFGPAVVVDVYTGYRDVEEYMGAGFVRDVLRYPLDNSDDYKDGYLINGEVLDVNGEKVLEALMVFRLERSGTPRVAYAYGYCWSTENYFVRVFYVCFGAQRSLTEDLPAFRELYNSIVVP